MQDKDKLTKETILESARQFARFSLNMASTAIGYAAEVLRDVEKELKDSSARFTKPESTSTTYEPPTSAASGSTSGAQSGTPPSQAPSTTPEGAKSGSSPQAGPSASSPKTSTPPQPPRA